MLGGFVDLCGFIAAAMTLMTFAQRTMLPMRVTALLANVFFILYGWWSAPLQPDRPTAND